MTAIAKRELLYVGSFGPASYLGGIEFIDRSRGQKAAEMMNEKLLKLKRERIKLWVFPEGTRRITGEIHVFKKGAFHAAIHAQVPIVPVVYSSYKYILDSDKKAFNSGEVIIEALPEIPTIGLTAKDVDQLIEKTRKMMIETFNKNSEEISKRSSLK